MPVSYAPIFKFDGDEYHGNAQRFATEKEAYDSAQDRFRVWIMPTGFSIRATSDPVNYRRDDGVDLSTAMIERGKLKNNEGN